MPSTQHTPGHWTARNNVGAGWEIVVPAGTQDFVEFTSGPEHPMFVETWIQFKTPDWNEQVEANARLIASAPELLEALETIQKWLLDTKQIPDDGSSHPLFVKSNNLAATAIAKATEAA